MLRARAAAHISACSLSAALPREGLQAIELRALQNVNAHISELLAQESTMREFREQQLEFREQQLEATQKQLLLAQKELALVRGGQGEGKRQDWNTESEDEASSGEDDEAAGTRVGVLSGDAAVDAAALKAAAGQVGRSMAWRVCLGGVVVVGCCWCWASTARVRGAGIKAGVWRPRSLPYSTNKSPTVPTLSAYQCVVVRYGRTCGFVCLCMHVMWCAGGCDDLSVV